eukprot:4315766-Pyramimonas_sp.AAC.1
MELPRKKARLTALCRENHVTQSALQSIVAALTDEDVPDAFSRSTQRRRREAIAGQATSFGKIIQPVHVGSTTIWFQHPFAFMEAACVQSSCFRALLTDALNKTGNFIRLLLYTDEITPGNALKDHKTRKLQAGHWSIADFSYPALQNELSWFTIVGCRADVADALEGGMAELFAHILRFFFGRPNGFDLREGVEFKIPGEASPRILTGKLECIIQDERAFKFATGVKGMGGHKLCGCCQNAASWWSNWLPDPTGFLVSSTCFDINQFEPHTDASVIGMQSRLAEVAALGEPSKLEELEIAFGYKYSSTSWLQDINLVSLGLMSAWCWDWMHCYLIDGVYVAELRCLLERLKPHGLGSE